MHVEREQLAAAHSTARQQLLAVRNHDHWTGQLASSPLCTAAAVSALVLAERHIDDTPENGSLLENSWHSGMLVRSELSELLSNSLGGLPASKTPTVAGETPTVAVRPWRRP